MDSHAARHEEEWRRMLTGEIKGLRRMRKVMNAVPAGPRCKLCAAPYGAPGKYFLRFLGFRPSELNRRICRACIRSLDKRPGGAEVELSLLFADVRGSTHLAEHLSPQEFSALMARFYGTAASVIDGHDGLVDKFVGDEVVALFIPGLAGEQHAAKAVAAAEDLLRATGNDGGGEPWIAVGAGVHTGVAYVGAVGEGDARDFTALGDSVNTASRLASSAGPGEILVSAAAAAASALETEPLTTRELQLRGRAGTVCAWVATGAAHEHVAE